MCVRGIIKFSVLRLSEDPEIKIADLPMYQYTGLAEVNSWDLHINDNC